MGNIECVVFQEVDGFEPGKPLPDGVEGWDATFSNAPKGQDPRWIDVDPANAKSPSFGRIDDAFTVGAAGYHPDFVLLGKFADEIPCDVCLCTAVRVTGVC
jgi:hypothetical protein